MFVESLELCGCTIFFQEPSKTTRSNGFGGGPRLIENNATDTPGPGSYTWDLKSYGPKWLGDSRDEASSRCWYAWRWLLFFYQPQVSR